MLTALLPDSVRPGPPWLLPVLAGVLLLALAVGDPGRIDRESPLLRSLSIALVGLLAVGALWATVELVDQLINGGPITKSASLLLRAGVTVWVLNVIAFSLLYWETDDGGAAARHWQTHRTPDFAFPQELNPGVAVEGWRPWYVDYLYLGFTNATAFSPTDAMPLTAWAKMTMMAQSLISLVVLSLVVANAVNVLA